MSRSVLPCLSVLEDPTLRYGLHTAVKVTPWPQTFCDRSTFLHSPAPEVQPNNFHARLSNKRNRSSNCVICRNKASALRHWGNGLVPLHRVGEPNVVLRDAWCCCCCWGNGLVPLHRVGESNVVLRDACCCCLERRHRVYCVSAGLENNVNANIKSQQDLTFRRLMSTIVDVQQR